MSSASPTPEKIVVSGFRHFFETADGPVQATGRVDITICAGEFVTLVGPSGCGKTTLLKAIAGFIKRLIDLIGLTGFEDRYPHELSGGMKQRVAVARTWAADPDVILMDEPFAAVDAMTRLTLQEELARLCAATNKTVFFITHSVDEAVFLGDRVLVMTPRPGEIKARIDVPRRAAGGRDWETFSADPQMQGIVEQVLRLVRPERGAKFTSPQRGEVGREAAG